MKAAEANAKRTGRGRLSRYSGLLNGAAQLVHDVFGREPIRAIEGVAAAAGIVGVVAILDPLDASFAAAWWLLVLVVVRNDLAEFMIPDEASLAIALLGLAYVVVAAAGSVFALIGALAGAAAAAALLWTIGRAFRWITGRDGLGFGDVKLMGASAVWLGPLQQAVALQLAVLAALAVILFEHRRGWRTRQDALPFGAFLAPAAWLVHVATALSPALLDGWS